MHRSIALRNRERLDPKEALRYDAYHLLDPRRQRHRAIQLHARRVKTGGDDNGKQDGAGQQEKKVSRDARA